MLSAIATACFCGLPAAISRRMLVEMVFRDLPRSSGIFHLQRALIPPAPRAGSGCAAGFFHCGGSARSAPLKPIGATSESAPL